LLRRVDAIGNGHGFLRAPGGTFTTFIPGLRIHLADCINPAGAITEAIKTQSAILRLPAGSPQRGTLTTIGSSGLHIHPTQWHQQVGTITGWYVDGNGLHGFLRARNGGLTTFNFPGVKGNTLPYAINPAGAITGTYQDAIGIHGFLRARNGTFTSFDPPGSAATQSNGINPAGAITGTFFERGLHCSRLPADPRPSR